MKEQKTNLQIKKVRKIFFRSLLSFIVLLLLLGIAFSLPIVQTKLAHYFTEKINKQYGTNIYVDQVAVTAFGSVKLKKVLIKDHHQDTLIFAKRINTSILDVNKLLNGDLLFGTLRADDLHLDIKTYKKEKDTNLDLFVAAFDDGSKSSTKFLLKASKLIITNSRVIVIDENNKNSLDAKFTKLNAETKNFKIYGPDVTAQINKMSFLDYRGLEMKELQADFTYTKKNILLEKLEFKTPYSNFKGSVKLFYKREDFSDFNNKVKFDIETTSAQISTSDVYHFYKDIAKNKVFNFSSNIKGTLNNLYFSNLSLVNPNHTQINGDVNFKNILSKPGKGLFYMKGRFAKLAASYDELVELLPNVLGKKLPKNLHKLGNFDLAGDIELTKKYINSDFVLNTNIGQILATLKMSNIDFIDNANYSGRIALNNFDLGKFINNAKLGSVTADADINGKGFTEKYLDTEFEGTFKSIYFNNYNYQNILCEGNFKKPIFNGKVNINDPNLFLDFEGKIDLSKRENSYDFNAVFDYANLYKLHFTNDKTSIFKGAINVLVNGSSANNLVGTISVSNASFQNSKDVYFFDKLDLSSQFDNNNERTIEVISSDAINASIVGKFDVFQIQKMIQNSLGSLYANYKSHLLKKGQYIKFNFSEFNKLIEIIYPEITFDESTSITGSINADSNDFKLKLFSKKINAFETDFDQVQMEINNRNPLYNTYFQIDSVKNKYYKIRDFSLINVTSNDTLSFRTEFKGGEKGKDYYNLNLYHTINQENKNVIGFNKSEMMFKDYIWFINEEENQNNRIIFDKSLVDFNFEKIVASHENQRISLNGFINGVKNKDLHLSFNEVNLNKITPDIEQFTFEGSVNGDVFINQEDDVYQPTAELNINNLVVNKHKLGNLDINIEGDELFRNFTINSEIENENFKSFKANGGLQIVNDKTNLDIDLNFEDFDIGILSNLGGDVFTNIRGAISGAIKIDGDIKDVDYNGRLFANKTGLTIPYLNVDYELKPSSVIDIAKNKFIIQKTKMIDSKYATEGTIDGIIKHKEFAEWELDLSVRSNRLLALDTKDYEDAPYFGTAFIKGSADIFGPTNGLTINVTAESEKGTDIKIPINDAEAVSESNYIHFLTKNEKYNITDSKTNNSRNYNGLEMNFDFNIDQDATMEVILDRNTQHGMKGTGKGGILFEINTNGKFKMTGDYVIWDGIYNYKYAGLIDKKFKVKNNSSIVWDGDPLKAALNIQAVKDNIKANPGVLLNSSTINQKTDVEVVIDIKGNISSPEPDFTINFPKVSSVVRSEIETILSDKDTRQKQAFNLLAYGGFLSKEGLNQSQITNVFYEKAGALFSQLFQEEDGKIQLNVDFVNADKTPGAETDGRIGVSVSSKINDKITINGNVGVPVGGINQSAIVGNVEIQYRVNEDGTLNLRLFNRENDITYIGQGIGYTQGLGVSYEVDFNTFNELVKKIFSKSNKNTTKVINSPDADSNMLPSYIIIEKEKKKNTPKEETSPNKEAIPPDEY